MVTEWEEGVGGGWGAPGASLLVDEDECHVGEGNGGHHPVYPPDCLS